MAMTTTQHGPDLTAFAAAFAAAIENRDADTLAAAYAEDAVVTLLDRDHPPSAPMVLTGRVAIHAWYSDVCARNIDHRVPGLVADGGGFAFEEQCTYPEGNRVVCLAVASVTDGLITRQTGSQSWD
jgi:ketosteroid isomerase-like protein